MIKSQSFDIGQALQSPAKVFSAPLDVVNHPALNVAAKFQVLDQWERQARALAAADDKAGGEESMLGHVRGAIRELSRRTDPKQGQALSGSLRV
jgi:hypothetical protein